MRFSILLLTFLIFLQMDTNAEELNIWIGTAGDNGIYHLILDAEKGKLSEPSQVAELPGAGFLIPVSYTHLPSPRDRTRSRMPSSA